MQWTEQARRDPRAALRRLGVLGGLGVGVDWQAHSINGIANIGGRNVF